MPSRIYDQCEALLQASLANYHDGSLPSNLSPSKGASKQQPRLLGRSQSSGLSGSQFSFVNGSGQSSQELAASQVSSGSEMLVRRGVAGVSPSDAAVQGRGWDWRSGFPRGATGEDVLAVLRLTLAKEIAGPWLDLE